MPNPCGLTDEQYALWLSDPALQAVCPNIEKGNPMHINQQQSYQSMWSDWEKNHPEVIERAKEILKNNPITKGSSTTIVQIVKENPLSLEALKDVARLYAEIADSYEELSCAMFKYIQTHSESHGDPPGSPQVVGK
jgi:hypothetical protein